MNRPRPDRSAEATQAPQLASALDAFFAWYYRTHPVSATFVGVHDHDHVLPDASPDGIRRARDGLEELRARFRRLPSEPMSGAERVDRLLAEGALDVQAWEFAGSHFWSGNPCLYTGEAIFGVIALLLRPFAPLEERAAAAVERMQAIPLFLRQARENVRLAPRAWTARAIRECDGALALLGTGLEIFAHDEGVAVPDEWPAAAGAAAVAFRDFRAYLATELQIRGTDHYASGPEAFDLLLRRGHFLNLNADALLALGREHLSRAEEELRERASALAVRDWREGLQRLPELHPPVQAYYQRFGEVWRGARAAAHAHGLVSWPEYPIRFVSQPRWAREAAPHLYFLFYRAPAAYDHLPVVDYHVPPVEPEMPAEEQRRRLRATNESVIKLNHVVHHGGLGHHVQNWYAYHRAASRIGRMAAVDCAGRIALFCGGTMAEGWACYATDLMEEVGFLTPLERLAHAHSRLRMAARAIADVQLHTGSWSLGETAAFYRDTAGLAPDAAEAEAVKNSMFPGTALMYLCGTAQIHDLRREMQGRSGFDLRRFHDRWLSYGSLPAALAAGEMRRVDSI